MKTITRLCCTGLFCLALLTGTSLGCPYDVPPAARLDTSEFIFVGEVRGYAGPVRGRGVAGEMWGLIVSPEAGVYLPCGPERFFEVYVPKAEGACTIKGWGKEELSRSYPLGSRVRVIAVNAGGLSGRKGAGNMRLAVTAGSDHGVLQVGAGAFPLDSVFDYASYVEQGASGVDLALELRKDLLRLRRAESDEERTAILGRLLYFPGRVDYARVVENHLRDRAAAEELKKKREAWERLRDARR